MSESFSGTHTLHFKLILGHLAYETTVKTHTRSRMREPQGNISNFGSPQAQETSSDVSVTVFLSIHIKILQNCRYFLVKRVSVLTEIFF